VTVRERMLAVYRGQTPDRVPVGIYSRYLPRGEGERLARGLGCGIIDYYPAVSMLAPPWHFGEGYLSEVRGCECRVDYLWEKGTLLYRRSYRTPLGELYQIMEPDPSGMGSEHIRKQYITRPEDYAIAIYIVENTVIRSNEAALRRRLDDLGGDGVVLGRLDRAPYQKLLIELVGAETLFIDLYTNPEPALELMGAMERKLDEGFALALETAADVFWQPDNITSDMTPPAYFEKYCQPFYRKRAEALRRADRPYVIHMDGRLSALRGLIGKEEADVLESVSLPEIGGDLTYRQAVELFADVTVLPNFPSNLCMGGEGEIRDAVAAMLREASGKPFMLQVSEDLPPEEWRRILPILCEQAIS